MSGKTNVVLVTGANGYMGSHLVDRLLLDPGCTVRGMVLEGTDESNLEVAKQHARFSVVYANLLDIPSLERACEGGVSIVYHLAALVTDWAPEAAFKRLIVDGTKNVVHAAISKGVNRLVYMSSLTVHGLGGHVGADETTPINPVKFFQYAVAKAEAEQFLAGIDREGKLRVTVVRPAFDIIGPRHVTAFYPMASAIEKGQFGFMNDGEKLICLVYVKNLVAGMVHVGNLPEAAGESYVISDVSWTWKKYVSEICQRLGCKMPTLNARFGLIAPFIRLVEWFYKAFKSKKAPLLTLYRISIPRNDIDFVQHKILKTGFVPPYSFEEGLDDTVAWYKEYKAIQGVAGK